MPTLKIYRKLTVISACTLLTFAAQAQNAKNGSSNSPKLFQVTTAETLPGDAVLVRGEDLDKVTQIQVARLTDDNVDNVPPGYMPLPREDDALDHGGTDRKAKDVADNKYVPADKLLQNSQSLKFVIPATWKEGVYSVRLTDAGNQATDFYVNVPQVKWVISEEGLNATAGSYLRIQGKNLLRKGLTGQVVLISKENKQAIRAKVANAFDGFSVSVNIPGSVSPGTYHLYYHNGQGGKTAWSEPLQVTVVSPSASKWDKKTFNVKDYGAKGDGVNNETSAFQSALAAAQQQGGGTVYVPHGRYMITAELQIPPFTMLKGESAAVTQLFWNPQSWEYNKLPNSLISGTHHFAVKDLNIWATRAWGIIMQNGPVEEMGNVLLENLVVRQSAQMSSKMYRTKASRDSVDAELNTRWTKTGIVIRGANLKMRNCDLNSSGMYTVAGSGFIQHCRFTRNNTGINQPYMTIQSKGLIFEDCYKQADGYAYGATIVESRDLYEARNVIPFDYTNDREVMTLDGGGGAYAGPVASANGSTINLPGGSNTIQTPANKWNGGGVFIIEGKGAGQFRRIASHTADAIQLDQPFLVAPDASSVISITTVRQNLYFVNNEVTDGGAYQLYGSAQNCVIAGLKMRRSDGIVCRGSLLYHGKQPSWYNDIVDCELREGNYSHWYGTSDQHSGYQCINLIGSGGAGLNIGALVRRNQLYDYSYISTSTGKDPNSVTDVIIEDNSINTAKEAITLGGVGTNTSNVLIRNNHYGNVEKRVNANQGLKQASYMIMEDGASPVKKPAVPENK